jgi:SAM-dependent methyltransferase
MSETQKVADYYDGAAREWDASHGVSRHSAVFGARLRGEIRKMVAGWPGAALELGAGTGPYVDVIAPLVGSLVATDVSGGMLAVFQQRLNSLGQRNVRLLQQDAYTLDAVASASVDTVYSIGLLETIGDLDRLFATCRRVLKPGGVFACIVSNGGSPWYIVRRWMEGEDRHGRTARLPTAHTISDALQRQGFKKPTVDYWGVLPPSIQNPLLGKIASLADAVVAPTPLAGVLGVLTIRTRLL